LALNLLGIDRKKEIYYFFNIYLLKKNKQIKKDLFKKNKFEKRMANSAFKTPQMHLIGKLAYAENFECSGLYAKFYFKAGANWALLSGSGYCETFLSYLNTDQVAPLEHPIDINYAAKSIRGWPRILVEVWTVDKNKKSTIGGYGIITIPTEGGYHRLKVDCWRPVSASGDQLLGTYPELEFKDVLVSSQSRYGLTSETTGSVIFELDVILKDFQLHGVLTKEGKK